MQIEIFYEQSAGKNAENKYKGRNRFLEKIKGIDKALLLTTKKLNKIEKAKTPDLVLQKKEEKNREWYEKFKWFFTTNGFLVLSGKDAKNNEQLVKKYFTENDLYFHAEIHGAPHVLLQNPDKKEIPEIDKKEAAFFAAIHSSAWKEQVYSIEVYSVNYGQVSKTANPGESLKTGAFVIKGKREYYKKINLELGVFFEPILKKVIVVPIDFNSQKKGFILKPGDLKKSDVCKILKEKFLKKGIHISIDDLMSVLPTGSFSLKE